MPVHEARQGTRFSYDFQNFFHPYVGKLLELLRRGKLEELLSPGTQETLEPFFEAAYAIHRDAETEVKSHDKEIDVDSAGAYGNYNWELFFHIPLTIAVHLSKTQRFAEAQRWYHYIFDPRSTDESLDPPQRYWKFRPFREERDPLQIAELLTILSIPDADATDTQREIKDQVERGYREIGERPFHPHTVARTRALAYQYHVVMKYLDNLIAWGDSLFMQDTIESINEATQHYVLAANLLGPRPEKVPPRGARPSQTFATLAERGLDPTGNALIEMEGQFPFNLTEPAPASGDSGHTEALFGIDGSLYFCVPPNEKLLGYWDTVADRLYKIRHCMNIEGVVRQLALFDPPLDPGMLTKAAAAGIDVGSVVAGTNQPAGPLRSLPLIQRAQELANEVRSLGAALLAAIEKGDAERLALLRQGHETKVQKLARDARFLQWKGAEEATEGLLRSRAIAWERYRYYLRMQGAELDEESIPEMPALTRPALSEENFDEVFEELVGRYESAAEPQALSDLRLVGSSSPSSQSGATGIGTLHLTSSEGAELSHLAAARDLRLASSTAEIVAKVLEAIPDFNVDLHFWGTGASSEVSGGTKLADATRIGAEVLRTLAGHESDQAGIAGRTAQHERRADEWALQANLAARELAHSGRQLIGSLIAEQVARHEYETVEAQIANSEEVDELLRGKFSNEELHTWMQGEISRLYYQWYRLAFDTARRAERTMKLELRRAELDRSDFVKFNYWDGGRRGLLSGEALHLDLKRMEMAYHEHNRRELELTRHVSLRQLDPIALLRLKATGSATFAIPEWLYDRDFPGHYMRRIKSVALSVPSVVGPYTPLPCTLSLHRSRIRVSPGLGDEPYEWQGPEDKRFAETFGPAESIATSTGTDDPGLFEANLRDERFLPFEGAGAVSAWRVDLPGDLRGFDYATISDVVLHVRYTARRGEESLGEEALDALKRAMEDADESGLALLLSLRHDFPTAWSEFASGANDLKITLGRDRFPYVVQDRRLEIGPQLELYAGARKLSTRTVDAPPGFSEALAEPPYEAELNLAPDPSVLTRAAADAFLVVPYGFQDA